MNAHVIRIQGSAWRPRKGGSVKLVIEVRPETQAQWVKALEMFAQRPELSVTVVAPKIVEHTYAPAGSGPTVPVVTTGPSDVIIFPAGTGANLNLGYNASESAVMKETVAIIKGEDTTEPALAASQPGYDAIGPKADVDCPEPECQLGLNHLGAHVLGAPLRPDCPLPDCNLLAGHNGKCVKKKVAK